MHLIDPFQTDENGEVLKPQQTFEQINQELRKFSSSLSERDQVVVLTKWDLAPEGEVFSETQAYFTKMGYECLSVSSVSGQGINKLLHTVAKHLDKDN